MRSRFDSSRFDSSLVGLQWALRLILLAMVLMGADYHHHATDAIKLSF